ncbi:MAG: hypothetical protein LVS60_19695 [Nodosilinea sp. LVE1205-7]
MALTTHWITLDLPLPALAADLLPLIKGALQQRGEPLRWAITQVDPTTHLITVEAVVIIADGR